MISKKVEDKIAREILELTQRTDQKITYSVHNAEDRVIISSTVDLEEGLRRAIKDFALELETEYDINVSTLFAAKY